MKVKTTAISAGPRGVLDADRVIELPDAKARELIDADAAVPADPEAKVTGRWPHGADVAPPKGGR